jgi:hypothetical protein
MRTSSARSAAIRSHALRDGVEADQPDLRVGLPLQHAHEIGVGHRRERMLFHARFAEQRIADEQVPAIQRAAVLGKDRAGDREAAVVADRERVEQGVGHRADVAGVGRIECRAVLEQELTAALRTQPGERLLRLGDRIGDGDRARLQRDDERVGLDAFRRRRHADRLHGAHAVAHEHVGEIGGAGEVVGDAAEERPRTAVGSTHRQEASEISGRPADRCRGKS